MDIAPKIAAKVSSIRLRDSDICELIVCQPAGRKSIEGQPEWRAWFAFAAQNVGGMFGLYFAEQCAATYEAVLACDKEAFNRFFHAMLDAGHYFAPSAFEAGFISAAHSAADIAATITAADMYFAAMAWAPASLG